MTTRARTGPPRKALPRNDRGRFAGRLVALREHHGMTVAALAEQCRVTSSCVWAWESGRTQPGMAGLRRLAGAYGVPLAELVGELFA